LVPTHVALILVWFGLWLVVGDGLWWVALLNRIVPQMFAPTPLVILLAVISRQRRLITVSFIPLLVFVALFWPYVIPRPAQMTGRPALRVMTYNVLYSNSDYDAVAGVILTYRPDLIALQEVQPKMMSKLTSRLNDTYPYSLMGHEHPYGTAAAFSHYPVVDSYVLDLESDRSAVVLKVKVDGTDATFISAHLLPYGLEWIALPDIPRTVNQRVRDQNRQASLLVQEAQKQDGPVIVACDCNSKETSDPHRILAGQMTSAARVTGWVIGDSMLAGAQQDTDVQHIDYMFYRGSLRATQVYSIRDSGGSDHLPVLALFDFESTVEPAPK
jgi:endonuclease/exonuclease/phosphatase (EEP) superfamily protein YafD